MLLVLLMCRRTRTVLQRSRLGRFLPLNMATFAHKVVGYVTGICILGHCILHMLHFCTLYISIQHYFEILDLFSLYIIMIRVSFKDFAGCWHELDLIATSVYYHSGNRLLLIIKYVVIDTLYGLSTHLCMLPRLIGIGWIRGGVVPVLGWPLLVLYVVIFLTSLAVVRRSIHYEVPYGDFTVLFPHPSCTMTMTTICTFIVVFSLV